MTRSPSDEACARRALNRICDRPEAVGGDVLDPETGPHDEWTIEVALTTDTCPPGVLCLLGQARMSIIHVQPRGTGINIVATTAPPQ